MTAIAKISERFFLFFTLIFLGALCAAPFFSGVYTFADALRGFELLFQFEEGGEFNTLNYPNSAHPEVSLFVSWWSPGQWFIPWILMKITGIQNLQLLQAILIALLIPVSFFGYAKLFRNFDYHGFSLWSSLALLVSSPLFFWKSLMYYGGDLLLLALLPWFILFLIKVRDRASFSSIFGLILLGSFGIFLKTTFIIVLLASFCYLFLRNQTNFSQRIRTIQPNLLTILLVIIFFKFTLLTGETPSSATDPEGWEGVPNTLGNDFLISLGSPFGILTGASNLLQKFSGQFGFLGMLGNLILFASTFFILFRVREQNHRHFELLFYFVLPFLLAFIPFYLMDKAISYEMRHFAPFAFLFFPAILEQVKSTFQINFSLLFVFGLISINSMFYLNNVSALSEKEVRQGIKIENEDLQLINDILAWDQSTTNGIFVIEDYWLPSFFVRNNDKWVWNIRENQCVTGVELDNPPKINYPLEKASQDHSTFLVDLKASKADIFKFVGENKFNENQTSKFFWGIYR